MFRHFLTLFLLITSLAKVIHCESGQSSESINNEDDDSVYKIGVGIADVTGPAVEVNMMGYAKLGQDTSGIHLRLRSRAFIIQDNGGNRLAYVNVDLAMIDQSIKTKVVQLLKDEFGSETYNVTNVMISATHTHSGPGGFLQYLLYILTAKGFDHQNFNLVCDGIVRSIRQAHKNMVSGRIYYNEGLLFDASINRSPSAYLNNPEDERALYKYDTDKILYLLKLVDMKGSDLGAITWFAVHPTSMNNTNRLISSDNKGWASLLMERHFNGKSVLPGKGSFVASFSAANLGDVSPNIKGPLCTNSGLPCNFDHSTCNGKNEYCIASGPGRDMFESTEIIATRQFEAALAIYSNATTVVSGPVRFVHQHLDMSKQTVRLANGSNVNTCLPSMGYSFAAGTIDGPGAFNFEQGQTSSNPLWNIVRNVISKPSQDLIDCQSPKPILLATGQMHFPYDWQPKILPTQLFGIGQVYIAGVPGEFTTMSGRRLRNAVRARIEKPDSSNARLDSEFIQTHLSQDGNADLPVKVILNGLSNAYSSYITTFEEYQIQRYEGASTIFGPYTLDAYIQQYSSLAADLVSGQQPPAGPDPPNLVDKQLSLNPGVVFDLAGIGREFGEVLSDAKEQYKTGQSVVVRMVSGNPRNDPRTEDSFLYVDQQQSDGSWTPIAADGSLETRFIWHKVSLLGQSEVTLVWQIPTDQSVGKYRIRHLGTYKSLMQRLHSYQGQSRDFDVIDSSS